jgi:hypothetical protein
MKKLLHSDDANSSTNRVFAFMLSKFYYSLEYALANEVVESNIKDAASKYTI